MIGLISALKRSLAAEWRLGCEKKSGSSEMHWETIGRVQGPGNMTWNGSSQLWGTLQGTSRLD